MITDIIKIIHIVAAISWMAGLFYLPRLYVYHAIQKNGSDTSETFKIMEYKLYNYIMNPAMIITWIMGCMLAIQYGLFFKPLFYIKIVSVVLMTVFHYILGYNLEKFKYDKNIKNHRYFRILNEIPTILLIIIITVVVLKYYR